MNLLLDMNIPEIWMPFLSDAGHRATHWSRVGDIRAEDTAIMRWAKTHGQVIFTNDLDFGALLYLTIVDPWCRCLRQRSAGSRPHPHASGLIHTSARLSAYCDEAIRLPENLRIFKMPVKPTFPPSRTIPSSALALFLAATFLITWGVIGIYILAPDTAARSFGEISGSHPLFFLATWSPAIAAFFIVYWHGGLPGIRAFLSRLLMGRVPWSWAAFILLFIPLVFVAGSLIKGGPVLATLPAGGVAAVVAVMFMMLFLGPVEEFGWRGVMQPLLQRHVAPIWAGLIIGITWGIWHLPAFFLAGVVFADWDFLPFFIGNVTLAVLVTPIFNSTRGSLLWPMLFHWQLINPFWADAQPWDTWILVLVTIIVVWRSRDKMFTREGAVTEVIPATRSAAPQPAE